MAVAATRPSDAARQPRQLRLQLDAFEGPIELLLSLIEGHRLPITQVSLAQVADQYMAQVRALPEPDANLLADFLQIGSKLLLLKSRALLLTEERDSVVEEAASDLEERLNSYRLFRAAALQLQEREYAGLRSFPTTGEPRVATALPPLAPLAPQALLQAMQRLLRDEPAPLPALQLAPRISVDEKRAHILDLLRFRPRVSLAEIAGRTVDDLVASFLAILELFRRGQVDVEQVAPFAELFVLRPTV